MSGEKRAVADPSWEFTVGLVRGILIGGGIVRVRSCVGGRQAACWEKAEGSGGAGEEGSRSCMGGNRLFGNVTVTGSPRCDSRVPGCPRPRHQLRLCDVAAVIYSLYFIMTTNGLMIIMKCKIKCKIRARFSPSAHKFALRFSL